MEVHRELGPGFLESAYVDAMERELAAREIPFQREVPLQVDYKGEPLKTRYRADLVCFGAVLVETKSVFTLHDVHEAQLIHYLRATGIETGLLINFGELSLKFQRYAVRPKRSADRLPLESA